MDHNEAIRKVERLFEREADHAHEVVVELEAMVPLLPNEPSRQLARQQIKTSRNQARDFRDLAQKIKET